MRAAIWAVNSLSYILGLFGLQWLGAVPLPVNTAGAGQGRPPLPYSKTSSKRKKLAQLDGMLETLAGGPANALELVRDYLDSSFFARRTPDKVGPPSLPLSRMLTVYQRAADETLMRIGKNPAALLRDLPPASPFHRTLATALGAGLGPCELDVTHWPV